MAVLSVVLSWGVVGAALLTFVAATIRLRELHGH